MSSSLRTTRRRTSASRSGRIARDTTPRARPRNTTRKQPPADSDFTVRFWGVRGSIPSPGPNTSRFGGNTSCVEVRCGDERLIFDAGSGIRELGQTLTAPVRAHIFLSHYHYDHLQGLPFFTPLFDPQNTFVVHGALSGGDGVREVLSRQMQQPYFPVTAEMIFRARVDYRDLSQRDELRIGEAKVTTLALNHPGGTLGYRVDYKGRSIVYATDVEHGGAGDEELIAFARDTDLLIYDAMYTEDEYAGRNGCSAKTGWGHSTWQASIVAANRARAKKLLLFHHDPTRDDDELDKLIRAARKLRPDTDAARESQIIAL